MHNGILVRERERGSEPFADADGGSADLVAGDSSCCIRYQLVIVLGVILIGGDSW